MRMTQRRLAELLGVDRTTVSKALSGSPTVSAELRDKVRKLAEELGYRPHASALSLKSERTRTISLVGAFTEVEGVQGSWLMLLHRAAQAMGYKCRIDSHADVRTVVSEASADGFVVFGANNTGGFVGGDALPAVFTDCSGAGNPVNSVTTDNFGAAAAAVEHLHGLGHKRIVFFGLVPWHGLSMERHLGYLAGLGRCGLPVTDGDTIIQDDWPVEIGDHEACMGGFMTAIDSGATAVITTKDVTAAAVLRALTQRGLKVPGDISVIAWDDTLVTRTSNPPLACIRQNMKPAAERAIEMLIGILDSGVGEVPGVVMPSDLVIRGSVGPAPDHP